MTNMRLRLCILVTALPAVMSGLGCGMPESEDAQLSEESGELIGGTKTNGVPETVALYAPDQYGTPTYKCSGVLIRDRVVLTAAHCALLHPTMVATKGGVSGGSFGTNVDEWHSNPAYKPGPSYDYHYDVGLLKLCCALPSNVAKPRNISFDTNPPSGTRMTVVSYGAINNGPPEVRNYVYFTWPQKTRMVHGGDSGGPVIRGDTGNVVRIVGGTAPEGDLFVPLNASQSWLQTTLNEIQNR